jgi:hypothetical protein
MPHVPSSELTNPRLHCVKKPVGAVILPTGFRISERVYFVRASLSMEHYSAVYTYIYVQSFTSFAFCNSFKTTAATSPRVIFAFGLILPFEPTISPLVRLKSTASAAHWDFVL